MLSSVFPRDHGRFRSLPLLGGVLDALCEWLAANGHPLSGLRRRITAAPHLERLLSEAGVQRLFDLTVSELLSFAPSSTRWTPQITASLIRSLARFLSERRALALRSPTLAERCVADYQRYLLDVRGLAPSTVEEQGCRIHELLRFLGYDEDPAKLGDLQVGDLQAFMVTMRSRRGRAGMQKVTAALRGFVRFLCARGEAPPGLAVQIDSPRVHKGERLPRGLPWELVHSLLATIDQSTAKGLRDYAMILLLATYGLRRGELPPLTLDHIDWHRRTILIERPKVGSPFFYLSRMKWRPLSRTICGAAGRPPLPVVCSSRSVLPRVRSRVM